ncbi:T9SS type A sorting domain-containing protein [Flavobacterium algicola]|uniref:T9SS type A sorting domain-containing protein n=1 Tax=Flavobacterium algicola TaxID=556529 RepID=UPI001EFDC263|nr:T9SS type A sorting domain-containing protein [Flavobacterium algicola]MCG9792333.1 T9SS type A sorting domain-containing protein [Flavobacterium algicola]
MMKTVQIIVSNFKNIIPYIVVCMLLITTKVNAQSQVPDPNQGLRADWMRGSLGLLWLPENNYNGSIERISIDEFLTQIKPLKTVDFVQVGLASPYIYSPVHTAPHPILESLWQGDLDGNGDPINLVVPRASAPDPFLSWIKAIKAAGLKTEVYVNSCNLLQWEAFGSAPDAFPDFSDRWKEYCDTDPTMQAFINSKSYHKDGVHDDRRPYMFCYAEFILKDYAVRYGDLIDAWCFDAAHVNMGGAGDDYSSGDVNTQRIFQAFADAVHAGNPNAAVTFNNGIGDRDSDPFIPYATPSLFEDYKFGHPFGGAGNMVEPRDPLYTVNFGICEYMRDNNGLPYANDDIAWNDNVVAHFFPKQSTTSWNDGGTPCLTDEEFVEWNNVGLINAGSITWGTPLINTNLQNSPNLILQSYALAQLQLVDTNLSEFQFPGAPNWARQYTILPSVYIGQTYSHTLVEGVDFWDPEAVGVTEIFAEGSFPSWLTVTQTEPGVWTLSGTPTETVATDYAFELKAEDADGATNRAVNLKVLEHPEGFTNTTNGTPVWKTDPMILSNAIADNNYEIYLQPNVDFYDFEGDKLTITKTTGADWLTVTEISDGIYYLSGTPALSDIGENIFTFNLSDGVQSSNASIKITVDQDPTTAHLIDVQIIATPTTDYGIDKVAKMISDTQTAPDGLATFKISIEVTPSAGRGVRSGLGGGTATASSWGIGNTPDADAKSINDVIFTGSEDEWVESITNIQIIDFNANGGSLTTDNISTYFKSIAIVNAQSTRDNVSLKIGELTFSQGKLAAQNVILNLMDATGVENITNFAIGTGNLEATNKWSVEGITVTVSFKDATLGTFNPILDNSTSLIVYPNPATDYLLLNYAIHAAQIINMTGKIVKVHAAESKKLDVSNLPTGIYILKGSNEEGKTVIKRFIKN